jgi:hypothetical protein
MGGEGELLHPAEALGWQVEAVKAGSGRALAQGVSPALNQVQHLGLGI